MNDIEIAHQVTLQNIEEVALKLGLKKDDLELYGKYKAKIDPKVGKGNKKGKLILVTAINPTPYGEGKTTVSIGLGDALRLLNKNALMVLREPSLGPVFGMKGGATGGGYSQVVPMEDINLHFTGDFHAITAVNNLICAAIDNHLYFGNELQLDPNRISFHRCLDVNDRSLREIEIGLSSAKETPRKEQFSITAASEIMIIFCLARDMEDLRKRLDDILVGYTFDNRPVYLKELHITGALLTLLKDAMKPNLVQTLEGNPVLIHGGPFANIAHGCNSVIATSLGLELSDFVVTEAGFGADLGAEKFLDITCPVGGFRPDALVLVVTAKALKYHAGVSKEDILKEEPDKISEGLSNLQAHIDNLRLYHVPFVVCLNQYTTDSEKEISIIQDFCAKQQVPFAVSSAYRDGGKGAIALAEEVLQLTNQENAYRPLVDLNLSIPDKISLLAKNIYHATKVEYSEVACEKIKELEAIGQANHPICVAKTQYSLSDDPKKLGYPQNYTIYVKDVQLYAGARLITVLLGSILTMPGLPQHPNYEKIDFVDGNIQGLF